MRKQHQTPGTNQDTIKQNTRQTNHEKSTTPGKKGTIKRTHQKTKRTNTSENKPREIKQVTPTQHIARQRTFQKTKKENNDPRK